MLYKKTVNGGFMSFDDGLKSGNYSKNTYSEDSAEFDSFERGCTQALKRGLLNIGRLRADFDYHSRNRPEFTKHGLKRSRTQPKLEESDRPRSICALVFDTTK